MCALVIDDLGIPNLQKMLDRIKDATTWESLILVAIASSISIHSPHSKKDISQSKRNRKGTHEINTPHIKDFTKEHGLLGHLLSLGDSSVCSLTPLTCE